MKYSEIKGDLFKSDKSYCLAHCISVDANMGAGIAVEFKNRYKGIKPFVISRNPSIGDCIPYNYDGRLVFNLITKKYYYGKPTYATFESSIISLKNMMLSLHKDKLAIPLLGSGLDKLSWAKNREIIKNIFKDTDIEIVLYRL